MEQEHSAEVAPSRTGMSRRVVVKSAAWSVPVFATVGVTPAFAATGDKILTSSNLQATRRASPNGVYVDYVWDVAWAPDAGVSSGTATFSAAIGYDSLPAATPVGATGMSFTLKESNSNPDVPQFVITVAFTYKGSRVSASFTVGTFSVINGRTVNPVTTVTPGINNPVIT